jgi:hypothetical protein
LGTNKVDISTITWPDGDKLISPFVYQNDKLVGFVDTKAMTVSGSATTTMSYSHIEADFSSIEEGTLTVDAPNAVVKKFSWSVADSGDDNFMATIKYKDCKTVDDVKAVDADYLINDIVDGVWREGLKDLTNGGSMFRSCSSLTSFSADLSSLTNGYQMFYACVGLTSFKSDLSSLYNGMEMFSGAKLDTASIQNIADTIVTQPSDMKGMISIGVGSANLNDQELAAFNTMASKNWTVYVGLNGGRPRPWTPTSLTPIDGEEQQTPIPFYAKPIQSDEEYARYIDAEGNFYNILGGNCIFGDDISTYGMFISEEDAAANMRLTPYSKPQTEIEK